MAQGYSLHIGLNYVDPNHYGGWDGKLNACEYDANDMQQIAKSTGFKNTILLRENAIRDNVINAIKEKAKKMTKGDIFLLTYSGHGAQIPDINSDEDDGIDETWCLFDGQLVDDELANLWGLFPEGARILFFSDSCHSGTIARFPDYGTPDTGDFKVKSAPDEIANRTYMQNKAFYDEIMVRNKIINSISCSVKLISGCQDDQYSYDGAFNGQFTARVKKVWNGGKFNGNYRQFHKRIKALLPERQIPNHFNIGIENESFESQKPFTI